MLNAALCALALLAADGPTPRSPAPLDRAVGRMSLPEGFRATLFAGEPDTRQPIAFTYDDRGRLWVVECDSYPVWLTPGPARKDRVLIFEDKDGDGKFDSRKVFLDDGANLTGIELGFGGVWLCSTPNLLFIADQDGDDAPDGPPKVLLDGWDTKGRHNLFNDLTWAPDGWLWGCNGITSNSRVGEPGTPDALRTPINCGVWRYHPTRKVFEVVANGTTNPWGLDFDALGEPFITNCVIPHLYHVIDGARYDRMFGQDFNTNTYTRIGTTADHIHWAGGSWTDSRGGSGKHGEAGGGHAHVGALIYQGTNWPEKYRGNVYTCNLHGNRVNRDILRAEGSGYVASHAPDFLMANDPWFRGIALKSGPDGGVTLIDWSDTDECHDTDVNGPERTTGRIYKITYGDVKPVKVDLAKLDSVELARLQNHPNVWHSRQARRLLHERAAAGADLSAAKVALRAMTEAGSRLPALWARHAIGDLDENTLITLSGDGSADVRTWAVRLLATDGKPSSAAVARFAAMAGPEPSAKVRLALASALQRLALEDRWAIAGPLLGHGEDARDANLPAMLWYGVEPLAATEPARALAMIEGAKVPLVRRHAARRVASLADAGPGIASLVGLAGSTNDALLRSDLLIGLGEALRGRKSAPMPEGWSSAAPRLFSAEPEARELALSIALIYGDPAAAALLKQTVVDASAGVDRRTRALQALVDRRAEGLASTAQALLNDPSLRGPALRALAAVDDRRTAALIVSKYPKFNDDEKADAVATLAARPATSLAMLDAVEAGTIPRRDVSTAIARQVSAFHDPKVAAALERSWGTIRPAGAEKAGRMLKYKAMLAQESLKDADPSRGRSVFAKSCGQCHKLFDAGGAVGPELTGSDRANLDYILENVLDPSATVAKDYRLTTVATADGRLIAGMVREEGKVLVLQTANERVTLPAEDVAERKESSASMMPEGIFDAMSEREVRDLVKYLSSKGQVPAGP